MTSEDYLENADPAIDARMLMDAARAARLRASARMQDMSIDLRLPEDARLSDYLRASVTMLADAVSQDLEKALCLSFASKIPQANLDASFVLEDPDCLQHFYHMAEAARIARALRQAASRDVLPASQRLELIANELGAQQVRKYISVTNLKVAGLADLPPHLQARTIWRAVEKLRAHCAASPGEFERAGLAIMPVAESLNPDEECPRQIEQLAQVIAVTDKVLLDALNEAWLPFFVHGIAMRAQLDPASIQEAMFEVGKARLVLQLKAAYVARDIVAQILARMAMAEGRTTPADDLELVRVIEAYDHLDLTDVHQALEDNRSAVS